VLLQDGGNISGSQTAQITLSNVLMADAANYSLMASNAFGTTNSLPASLTVIDPAIWGGPGNQTAQPGQVVVFRVTAGGTPPLSYQWRKNGSAIIGATDSSLSLNSVQSSDNAGYDVIVSNLFGSLTSAVATLFVNDALPDAFNPASGNSVFTLVPQADGHL